MTPDGVVFKAELGVSNYIIPGDAYTIIWRYIHPIEMDTTTTTTAASQVAKVGYSANIRFLIVVKKFSFTC